MSKFQNAAPQGKSNHEFIQKSVEFILHDKHLREYDWQPSHPHTLKKYEDELEIHLPQAFKEYLLAIGNTDEQMIFGRDAEMGFLTDVLKPEPWEAEEVLEYENS